MKKLFDIGMELMKKYKSIILYMIFGVLTTVISVISYAIFTRLFHVDYIVSNVVAWILAVTFAYLTNRSLVFESEAKTKIHITKEIFLFFLARIVTLLVETGVLYISVDLLHLNDMVMKIVANLVVIVLNYFFSKFLIFSKKRIKTNSSKINEIDENNMKTKTQI